MSFRLQFIQIILVACFCSLAALSGMAQDAPLTPKSLEAALDAKPIGDDAAKLAERVRAWFGADALQKGPNAKIEDMTVAWAVEAPGAKHAPQVESTDGAFDRYLTRLGDTDIYALAVTLYQGAGMRYYYDVDGNHLGGGQFELYHYPPELREQPGVPKGKLTQQPTWKSKIFADTERSWWVYVPAEYKPEQPACVMIFQDGGAYIGFVPATFDNLIAKGEMPITAAIFLDPGHFPDNRPNNERSFEYDTLSDQYSRFLLEEILPEVEKTIKLRHDPASRAVAGLSSGGICAFTAAWQRPDQFGKVLSWIGSFTDLAAGKTGIEGGHNYPFLIRRMDKKPIRVFLQDGANDLDNPFGNWPLANQSMAKALAFKGYDYKFVFGHGFHSSDHGRSIFPDSLRWLWRDYKPE